MVRLITPVYPNEDVEDADKRLVSFTREIVPVLNFYLNEMFTTETQSTQRRAYLFSFAGERPANEKPSAAARQASCLALALPFR